MSEKPVKPVLILKDFVIAFLLVGAYAILLSALRYYYHTSFRFQESEVPIVWIALFFSTLTFASIFLLGRLLSYPYAVLALGNGVCFMSLNIITDFTDDLPLELHAAYIGLILVVTLFALLARLKIR